MIDYRREIPFNLRNDNNSEALDSANRKIAAARNKREFEKMSKKNKDAQKT